MATRIYFPTNSSPLYDVLAAAAWEAGEPAFKGLCSAVKTGAGFQFYSASKDAAAQPFDVPVIQYVSEPLKAQTISGTVKGQFRVYQSHLFSWFSRALVIRVVSNDGYTVRGTLLSHFPASLVSEWDTSGQNRALPPADTALTEVACQEGDRLVIEIGFRSFNTDDTHAYHGYLEVGEMLSAEDLPENETETEQKNPWLEFSQNLVWYSEPYALAAAGALNLTGAGQMAVSSPGVFAGAADGHLQITGEGTLDALTPGVLALAGSGSLEFVGGAVLTASLPEPPRLELAAGGCLRFQGEAEVNFVQPTAPPRLDLVAGGYLALSGGNHISFAKALVLELAAAGYLSLGGASLPSLGFIYPDAPPVAAFAADGCLELTGAGVLDIPQGLTAAYAAHTGLGSTALLLLSGDAALGFIRPLALPLAGAGEMLLESPEEPEDGVYDTWALTGFRLEPSMYSNFAFNSYARHRGKYYGAKDDGVYLLEGEDDAGAEIHPGMRIGPTNFGSHRFKRVHLLRLGGDCGQARARISDGNGAASESDVEGGVATGFRPVSGREITLDLTDFKSLDHLEIVPKVLARR